MTDAFIYDHVRTPRGRGKPDGSLAYRLDAPPRGDGAEGGQGSQPSRPPRCRRRRDGLCRSGRRSGRRHRSDGRARRGLWRDGAGRADQPLLRLGPRLGQFRRRTGDERTARHDDRRRRRVDEPRRHRRLRRRVAGRSFVRDPCLFHAARRVGGLDRDEIRLFARRRRRLRGRVRRSAPRRPGRRAVSRSRSRRCSTSTGFRCSTATSTCGRAPTCNRSRRSSPHSSFRASKAASTRSPFRLIRRSSASSMSITPAIRRASSTAPPRCCWARATPARKPASSLERASAPSPISVLSRRSC